MLPFTIQIQLGEPIYEQIVRAVKKAVATGQLQPGVQMPSVRVISRELSVNPNTVQKAISRLTDEGVLASHPGSGSFVADRRPSPPCRAAQRASNRSSNNCSSNPPTTGSRPTNSLDLIRQHHQKIHGNDH